MHIRALIFLYYFYFTAAVNAVNSSVARTPDQILKKFSTYPSKTQKKVCIFIFIVFKQ